MTIEFRDIRGQHNPMAVCSGCNRDASKTRISSYCIRAWDHKPLLCDECEAAA